MVLAVRKQSKPLGQITRGKTAPNRLRQTDVFLAIAYPELIRAAQGVYVDLGYGAYPITTLETWQRLRKLNPSLRVVGVEIDPDRVAEAEPYTRPGLEFRFGGFNLPLQSGESVSVIRAFNVLRQYGESEVEDALVSLNQSLDEDGLLLEGTCDPSGRLLTFNVYQKLSTKHPELVEGCDTLERIAFVLAPRLSAIGPNFQPRDFQAVLPKNFIHQAEPGGAIDTFFGAWHKSWQWARARTSEGVRQIFSVAALRLDDHYGYGVDKRPALLKRGFLCLGSSWPLVNSLRENREVMTDTAPTRRGAGNWQLLTEH